MADIEVIKKYKFFDLEFDSLADAAVFFDISYTMASNVFNGHRKPSSKMMEKAGIKKTTIYERTK